MGRTVQGGRLNNPWYSSERDKRLAAHLDVGGEITGTKKGHPRKETALYFGKVAKAFISTLYVLVVVRTRGVFKHLTGLLTRYCRGNGMSSGIAPSWHCPLAVVWRLAPQDLDMAWMTTQVASKRV